MAKKVRPSANSAAPAPRQKPLSPADPATPASPPTPANPPADSQAPASFKLRITRVPRKPRTPRPVKPPELNNHVSVHIISTPDGGGPPVSQRSGRVIEPGPAPAPPAAKPPAPKPAQPVAAATPAQPAAAKPPSAPVAQRTPPPPAPAAPAPAPKPSLRLVAPPTGAKPATPATSAAPATPTAATAPTPPAAALLAAADAALRHDTPPAGTPLGSPTPVHKSALNLSPMEEVLWSARLQKAKEVVAAQMKVRVNSGKLVRRYTAIDHDDGLFEIETAKGFYVVVLSKTGEYSIYWRHDRKAY